MAEVEKDAASIASTQVDEEADKTPPLPNGQSSGSDSLIHAEADGESAASSPRKLTGGGENGNFGRNNEGRRNHHVITQEGNGRKSNFNAYKPHIPRNRRGFHSSGFPSYSNFGGNPQWPRPGTGTRQRSVEEVGGGDGSELCTYPLIYVTPIGMVAIVMSKSILIEMTVDGSIRLVHFGDFSVFINKTGTVSSVTHNMLRVHHSDNKVFCQFNNITEKLAIIADCGVLFTMDHLGESYLVSQANGRGATALVVDSSEFPKLTGDQSVLQMYQGGVTGPHLTSRCSEIVRLAHYNRLADGSIICNINGWSIRHTKRGSIHVDSTSRHITYHHDTQTLLVRSHNIEVGLEKNAEKCHVKKGVRRVHISRSGMVVSDGGCHTSMDHLGCIITCN